MRRLTRPRGMGVIELMVVVVIIALLASLAVPWMGDFFRNAQLREAANTTHAMLLNARTEALKRDGQVTIRLSGSRLELLDSSDNALMTSTLPASVAASAANDSGVSISQIVFGGAGRTVPFGSNYHIDLVPMDFSCDADQARCPRLQVRAGGAVKLCSTQGSC